MAASTATRVENGRVEPTVAMRARLLGAAGQTLQLSVKPGRRLLGDDA